MIVTVPVVLLWLLSSYACHCLMIVIVANLLDCQFTLATAFFSISWIFRWQQLLLTFCNQRLNSLDHYLILQKNMNYTYCDLQSPSVIISWDHWVWSSCSFQSSLTRAGAGAVLFHFSWQLYNPGVSRTRQGPRPSIREVFWTLSSDSFHAKFL